MTVVHKKTEPVTRHAVLMITSTHSLTIDPAEAEASENSRVQERGHRKDEMR